jgi:hypothetical protein
MVSDLSLLQPLKAFFLMPVTLNLYPFQVMYFGIVTDFILFDLDLNIITVPFFLLDFVMQ